MLKLNHTLEQMDLPDIYGTFLPKGVEHTFFSSAHRTFSRIDHMRHHKINLSKFEKIEIIPAIFSDHSGTKLEINNKKKVSRSENMWK